MEYFHGIKVIEESDVKQKITAVSSNVIGIVGTAEKGEYDEPIYIDTPSDLKKKLGELSDRTTLVRAIKAIYEVSEPRIVAVRVRNPNLTEKETLIDFGAAGGQNLFAVDSTTKATASAVTGDASAKQLEVTLTGVGATTPLQAAFNADFSPAKNLDVIASLGFSVGNKTQAELTFDFYVTTSSGVYKTSSYKVSPSKKIDLELSLDRREWTKLDATPAAGVAVEGQDEVARFGFIFKTTSGETTGSVTISNFNVVRPLRVTESLASEEEPRSRRRNTRAIRESDELATRAAENNIVRESAIHPEIAAEYVPDANVIANAIGSIDTKTGVYALLKSKLRPKIFVAPYFSHDDGVCGALSNVASHFRGVFLFDPSLSDAKDKEGMTRYAERCKSLPSGSSRAFATGAWASKTPNPDIGVMPLSSFIAGDMAASPFWVSPSNKVLKAVSDVFYTVDYTLGVPNPLADSLNKVGVNFVIHEMGLRFWGNRTLGARDGAPDKEAAFKFVTTRRIADAINDSIVQANLSSIDQNINRGFGENIVEKTNAFIRELKSQGAIINGKAWLSKEDNPPESLMNGEFVITFDFTTPPPAEAITFKSRLTSNYIEEVL